jgi:hypothetical protein
MRGKRIAAGTPDVAIGRAFARSVGSSGYGDVSRKKAGGT